MDKLDHLGWVVQRNCLVGGALFGVRTNSHAMGEWIDVVLGDYLTDEPTDPYYSLHLPEERHVGTGLNVLYRESIAHVRSASLVTVVAGLLAEIEALLFPERADALYLQYAPIRIDDLVVLLPDVIPPYIDTLGGRIRKAGITLPTAVNVAIDLETARPVPIMPLLDLPGDPYEPFRAGGDTGAVERVPMDGRLDAILSTGVYEQPLIGLEPGFQAYRMAFGAHNLGMLGASGLETLGRLALSAPCYEVHAPNTRRLLEALLLAAASLEGEIASPIADPAA